LSGPSNEGFTGADVLAFLNVDVPPGGMAYSLDVLPSSLSDVDLAHALAISP